MCTHTHAHTHTHTHTQLENIRRKHNYLPLIMELLKTLAKKGELVPLVDKVHIRRNLQAVRLFVLRVNREVSNCGMYEPSVWPFYMCTWLACIISTLTIPWHWNCLPNKPEVLF